MTGDGASVFDGFSKALLGVVELFDEAQQAPQQRRRPATDAASVVKSAAETPASASSIKGRKGKLVQPRVSQTDDMLSHDTGSSARTTVSSSGAFSPQQAIAQPAVPHSPAQDMTASTIRSGQSAQSKGLLESVGDNSARVCHWPPIACVRPCQTSACEALCHKVSVCVCVCVLPCFARASALPTIRSC